MRSRLRWCILNLTAEAKQKQATRVVSRWAIGKSALSLYTHTLTRSSLYRIDHHRVTQSKMRKVVINKQGIIHSRTYLTSYLNKAPVGDKPKFPLANAHYSTSRASENSVRSTFKVNFSNFDLKKRTNELRSNRKRYPFSNIPERHYFLYLCFTRNRVLIFLFFSTWRSWTKRKSRTSLLKSYFINRYAFCDVSL